MIKKFPVTSEKGYEYLVKLEEYMDDWANEPSLKAKVFEVVETKSIFGRPKTKERLLHTSYYGDTHSCYFDYVKAVKTTVAKYETTSAFIKWENEDSNIKKLEEWNGDCQ